VRIAWFQGHVWDQKRGIGLRALESSQTVAVTQSEVPAAIPYAPTEPPALARSIAMELVTRYGLRPVDQRDSRLGSLAGQYELAMAAWTGSRGVLVGFYRPTADPLGAGEDLATRCRDGLTWGVERITTQRAQTCDVLIVVVGKVGKLTLTPPPKGPVSVGVVAIDPESGEANTLLPVPSGLPSLRSMRSHLRSIRSGLEVPTLAAIDVAGQQMVQAGYQKPAVRPMAKTPVVTYSLIGFLIAVYAVEKGLLIRNVSLGLTDLGALVNIGGTHLIGAHDPSIGAWWRYVSSAFLHDDQSYLHIAFNSFALWNIGRFVEIWYGRLVFLGTFLLTAVVGGITWVVLTSGDTALGITIGASGGITGLMGLLILVGRFQGRQFPHAAAKGVRQWIGINAALILFMGITGLGGLVNNYAHVGGFVGGMALALVLPPRAAIGGRDLRPVETAVLALVIAGAAVALIFAGLHVQSVIDSSSAISIDARFTPTATVGASSDFDFTVKNAGNTRITNLTILFDDGDHFLDHYTVITSGPCTVEKSLPGLACGPLAPGSQVQFTMTAQPRDAGNFTFKFHVGDNSLYLNEADGELYTYSWAQSIGS
jgi:membrane associated rhomboid family serine protease